MKLSAYVDASYGDDESDIKSTSGHLIYLGKNLISCKSIKQKTVSLSSCEAEINAAVDCCRDILWAKNLMEEIGFIKDTPIRIMEDNQACIAITQGVPRTKHISVKTAFLREIVSKKHVEFVYCPSSEMAADALTKSLGVHVMTRHREAMGLRDGGV